MIFAEDFICHLKLIPSRMPNKTATSQIYGRHFSERCYCKLFCVWFNRNAVDGSVVSTESVLSFTTMSQLVEGGEEIQRGKRKKKKEK